MNLLFANPFLFDEGDVGGASGIGDDNPNTDDDNDDDKGDDGLSSADIAKREYEKRAKKRTDKVLEAIGKLETLQKAMDTRLSKFEEELDGRKKSGRPKSEETEAIELLKKQLQTIGDELTTKVEARLTELHTQVAAINQNQSRRSLLVSMGVQDNFLRRYDAHPNMIPDEYWDDRDELVSFIDDLGGLKPKKSETPTMDGRSPNGKRDIPKVPINPEAGNLSTETKPKVGIEASIEAITDRVDKLFDSAKNADGTTRALKKRELEELFTLTDKEQKLRSATKG